MDLSKIKKFIKKDGDKFIVLENGEPALVVLSFREYEKLLGYHRVPPESPDAGFFDFAPEGLDETEFAAPPDAPHTPPKREASHAEAAPGRDLAIRLEDIRLEDLPI